ncbi:MAG TPA: glycosyltransferase family 1 protein [Bacteroidetes bacterium]|nr:glycosyltransferase family 1 protein [Bacteroidota bacterium]
MKVLMFGWEFPPHISGGLGTASYGITRGMSKIEDVELIFVVPKLYGDEDSGVAKLVGAENIKMSFENEELKQFYKQQSISSISEKIKDEEVYSVDEFMKKITKIEINSFLTPYLSPDNFEAYLKNIGIEDLSRVRVTKDGKIVYYENGEYREIILDRFEKSTLTDEGYFQFSGKYGANLIEEVRNYGKVAAKIAMQYDFDIIHAHDWLTYLAGIEAKRISGKPLVIHVHATEYDRSGENVNPVVFSIEKAGMVNADRIVTVSNLTKNIVTEKYKIDEKKITTVYNAVEPVASQRSHYRKTVDEKIVTFLGRVTYQKGPEYFVEAAKLVLDRTPNVRFVMAGSGDLLRRMILRAAQLQINHKFHFTDFLKGDDVDRMFSISDVYVMPSVSEPFGISPLEAMRSNVPVIISKQSGVAEILKYAIKVDFWDTQAIANAIYGLVSYDGLSEFFAKYGKTEVDSLKWENAAQNLKAVYDTVYPVYQTL